MPLTSRTRAHSGREARSFTSCSTRPGQGASSFSCSTPLKTVNPGPAEDQGTCVLKRLRGTSTSEGNLSSTRPRAAPGAGETGRPSAFPTRGSSVPARPRPAPHPRGHPAARPGRRQRAGPSPPPPVSAPGEGRLPLSPNSPPRTYSSLAATTGRSQGRLLPEQPLFCFRCEIAASGAARPRPRPKSFAAVVISGSGAVGGRPGKGRVPPE